MKRLFFCFVFAALILGSVWSQKKLDDTNYLIYDFSVFVNKGLRTQNMSTADKNAVVNQFNGKKVYGFDGFDLYGYKKNVHPSMEGMTTADLEAIKYGVTDGTTTRVTKADGKPHSIIGYSQGGLRALGYITQLKKNSSYGSVNNLDAVITISGVDQGLKMLEGSPGSLSAFKNRMNGAVNIIGNGFYAAINVLNADPYLGAISPILRNKTSTVTNVGFDFIFTMIPPAWRWYMLEAWAGTNVNTLPQLAGMIPQSPYITNNVVKTTEHSYRVKTGTELACEWRYTTKILGIKVWYLWIGYVDVYGKKVALEATPQFDLNVPVGFIVGTDSNSIRLATDEIAQLAQQAQRANPGLGADTVARLALAVDESTVRNTCNALGAFFATVEGLHLAKNIGLIGLLTGSITYQSDAKRAKNFMRDIDGELNTLKGSSSNDGVAAVESQHIPRTFYDPNTKVTRTKLNQVVGNSSKGYAEINLNHAKIVERMDTFLEAREMLRRAEAIRIAQKLR
jgi:hypothetical protein